MSQNGTDTSKASKASTVDQSDHTTLPSRLPPRRRSNAAKRRCATRSTMAGVMSRATSSSAITTMSGVASASTTKGANTARRLPKPIDSSQLSRKETSSQVSSQPMTEAMAASQNK